MKVLPTPKFASRTVQVPGMGPVHRPMPVQPFDVPDRLAPWLLENGYVQAVDGETPEPSADPETPAPEPPVSEVAPEPEQPSDDASGETEELGDEEIVDLLIALDKLSAQEIADAIDGVGLTTAKKLKRSPLTEFEQLSTVLNKAQLVAVVGWFRALP